MKRITDRSPLLLISPDREGHLSAKAEEEKKPSTLLLRGRGYPPRLLLSLELSCYCLAAALLMRFCFDYGLFQAAYRQWINGSPVFTIWLT